MRRRDFVGVSTAGLMTMLPMGGRAQSRVTVVYIGGWDCPNCTQWKNKYKADWLASPEFGKVKWVMVDPQSLRQAYEARNWPSDLKPILDNLPVKSGTPRFLVLKDGAVVANRDGVASWLTIYGDVKKLI